jgi:hypothetical protein
MKLEEIIEQTISLADQYGLESAEKRMQRRAEAFLSEGRCEDVEAGELVGAEK